MVARENAISTEATWLPVIGKALAFFCMKSAEADGKFKNLLDRVDFLEAMGLPTSDAAAAAGSTKASVDELRRVARNRKKAVKNGKTKKKPSRTRR